MLSLYEREVPTCVADGVYSSLVNFLKCWHAVQWHSKKASLTRYSIRILWQKVSGSAKVLMKLNQLSRQKVAQAGIRQIEQVGAGWGRPVHKCEKSQPSVERGGRTGSNSKRLRTKMRAIRAVTTITQVEKKTHRHYNLNCYWNC